MTHGARAETTFDCRDVQRLLEPYLDGEFDEAERAGLEGHLASCTPCRNASAAGALFVFAGHRSMDPMVEEAVRKHARDLPLELSAASLGPEAIPAILASKLDFNPRPPAFRASGVKLVGARL